MEEDFRALLLASGAVTAICGTRINFGAHPQGQSFPAIVLNTASDLSGHTLDGPESGSDAIAQVDCYGVTYGAAKGLARAVRAAVDGYKGGNIEAVFFRGSRDGREGGANEAERLYRVSQDFTVRYQIT